MPSTQPRYRRLPWAGLAGAKASSHTELLRVVDTSFKEEINEPRNGLESRGAAGRFGGLSDRLVRRG
jgi:hypothetical protein